MRKLIVLFAAFALSRAYRTGSHSLWMMATYIKGKTPFPEFSAFAVLDDIVFGRYDKNEAKAVHIDLHLTTSTDTFDEDDTSYAAGVMYYVLDRMESRVSRMNTFFNHSEISVLQKVVGCELLDDDKPGMMRTRDAYNGQPLVKDCYDGNSLHIEWMLPHLEDKGWTLNMDFPFRYKMNYYPNCIRYLKKHLWKERNRVLKKVKPRVRLLQKRLPDSREVRVTCLATGFYPRHINLTLLRDDQPVPDRQITGGELLPNGDETYQMRKSLEVSTEELQQHNFTCTAQHLSLDNRLDIDLEREWASGNGMECSVVVAVLVCLAGAVVVFIKCRGKHKVIHYGTGRCFQTSPQQGNPTSDPSTLEREIEDVT